MPTKTDGDVIIIGAGPAGLTAGLYAARAGLRAMLIDKQGPGGQMVWCDNVENFPGVPPPISGVELVDRMRRQAESFGAQIRDGEATRIEVLDDRAFAVRLADGKSLTALSVILAAGAVPRRLGVPGEREFTGRGVSYCATCDAAFFKGKDVLLVGGGNTAVQETLFLTRFVRQVTIIHRRDRLRAAHLLRERLKAAGDRIQFLCKSVIASIEGDTKVTGAVVRNVETGETRQVPCDGVFVFVGLVPSNQFVKDFVALDEQGYVVADEELRTSVPGVFVCGDLRRKPLRQIVTACADGAIAAQSALHYVDRLRGTEYV